MVDKNNPRLGFFHRWIIEFAKHCESIIVITLEKGVYELPENVQVLSLGKEEGISRLRYLYQFYSYVWLERKKYDVVFVHMNPVYIVLGGILWRLWSKRLVLWYTHKSVDIKLRIAVFFSHLVLTASKESFRIKTSKKRVMGHGIDTDFFFPDPKIMRTSTLLSVGRLMPTKRHDLVIESAAQAKQPVDIVGDGPEEGKLKILSQKLGVSAKFLGPLTQMQLRDEYRKAGFFIHTSETGSLDKVVLEALACNVKVISTSNSLSDLPIIKVMATPQAIVYAISNNTKIDTQSYMFIREHHSLQQLIPRLIETMKNI